MQKKKVIIPSHQNLFIFLKNKPLNISHWLAKMPLSGGEAKAAQRFTDAIFGKDNASRGLRDDSPFDLYDFFLRAQARMTQEQVDKFFEENPTVRHYKGLPLKEARVRIAREYTKWAWISQEQKKASQPSAKPSED